MKPRLLAPLLCSVLLALPATAAHAQGTTRYDFALSASHYQVGAEAEGSTAILNVSREDRAQHRRTETAYVSRATTEGGIRAVLPGIGRIAMRFHPTGPWRPIHKCLKGLSPERRVGVFVGRLRFVGEDRYLVLDRRRVAGSERSARRRCSTPGGDRRSRRRPSRRPLRLALPSTEPSPGKRDPGTQVVADLHDGPLAREFWAYKRPDRPLKLVAVEEDVRGGLGTYRALSTLAPRSDLSVDPKLSTAHLKGVAPFSGSATLTRAANGSRLFTGNLTASFIGDPGVPLTGPEYRTRLSRGF